MNPVTHRAYIDHSSVYNDEEGLYYCGLDCMQNQIQQEPTVEGTENKEKVLSAELKEVHYRRRQADGGDEFPDWVVLIMTK